MVCAYRRDGKIFDQRYRVRRVGHDGPRRSKRRPRRTQSRPLRCHLEHCFLSAKISDRPNRTHRPTTLSRRRRVDIAPPETPPSHPIVHGLTPEFSLAVKCPPITTNREPTEMDRMLNIEQVAERLGTSPRFVRRLVAERRIAFNKVGRRIRFNATDVEQFIQAGRVEPWASN